MQIQSCKCKKKSIYDFKFINVKKNYNFRVVNYKKVIKVVQNVMTLVKKKSHDTCYDLHPKWVII